MLEDAFNEARAYYPELNGLAISLDTLDMTFTPRKVVFAKVRALKAIDGSDKWIIFFNRRVLKYHPPREAVIQILCHELEHIHNGDVRLSTKRTSTRPHAGGRIDKAVHERIGHIFEDAEQWKKGFLEKYMK